MATRKPKRLGQIRFTIDAYTANRVDLLAAHLETSGSGFFRQAFHDALKSMGSNAQEIETLERTEAIRNRISLLGSHAYKYYCSDIMRTAYTDAENRMRDTISSFGELFDSTIPPASSIIDGYEAGFPITNPVKGGIHVVQEEIDQFNQSAVRLGYLPDTVMYASTLATLDRAESHLNRGHSILAVASTFFDDR